MAAALEAIVLSKRFPVTSSKQFALVAIYELIQLVNRLEPIPDSDVAILESMNVLNHNYQVIVRYDAALRHKCETVHSLVDRGLKNNARIMVHDMLKTIQRIKNRELREKHLKRIRTEFSGLMKSAKPVSGRPVRSKKREE